MGFLLVLGAFLSLETMLSSPNKNRMEILVSAVEITRCVKTSIEDGNFTVYI